MTSSRGVLLANLGSPDSPQEADVRVFLDEFLMDPRILDMPYPLRWLIVKAFILPKRPAQSAHAYQTIWWEQGSPLIVLTDRVRARLEAALNMPVVMGMRYGHPSVQEAMTILLEQISPGGEIILFPMYPHYAMSTYETLVLRALKGMEQVLGLKPTPDRQAQTWLRQAVIQAEGVPFSRPVGPYILTVIPPHYQHPGYIRALSESIRPYLEAGAWDHLLFSYHGIPQRHLRKTAPPGSPCLQDGCCRAHATATHHRLCYRHQVHATTWAVARALHLPPERYSISFQSRLGRDAWLQPFTADVLVSLARAGVKHLAVVTPSFTVDCLETLEEIGISGRETFLEAGGTSFQLIPCLNDREDWVQVMAEMVPTGKA